MCDCTVKDGTSACYLGGCYCNRDDAAAEARESGLLVRCGGGLPCACTMLGPAIADAGDVGRGSLDIPPTPPSERLEEALAAVGKDVSAPSSVFLKRTSVGEGVGKSCCGGNGGNGVLPSGGSSPIASGMMTNTSFEERVDSVSGEGGMGYEGTPRSKGCCGNRGRQSGESALQGQEIGISCESKKVGNRVHPWDEDILSPQQEVPPGPPASLACRVKGEETTAGAGASSVGNPPPLDCIHNGGPARREKRAKCHCGGSRGDVCYCGADCECLAPDVESASLAIVKLSSGKDSTGSCCCPTYVAPSTFSETASAPQWNAGSLSNYGGVEDVKLLGSVENGIERETPIASADSRKAEAMKSRDENSVALAVLPEKRKPSCCPRVDSPSAARDGCCGQSDASGPPKRRGRTGTGDKFVPRSAPSAKRPYACPHESCGATFVFKQNRDRHLIEVHQPERRPFVCKKPGCGAAFKNSSGLKQHESTVHEKNRPFKCDLCTASFGQRNHLTQHVQAVHLGSRPFVCGVCGAKFSNRGNLNQHMRRRKHGPNDGAAASSSVVQEATN